MFLGSAKRRSFQLMILFASILGFHCSNKQSRGNQRLANNNNRVGLSSSVMKATNATTGGGCGTRFLPAALDENVTNYCVDLIGMRMENFPPKKDDLVKINYDDQVHIIYIGLY